MSDVNVKLKQCYELIKEFNSLINERLIQLEIATGLIRDVQCLHVRVEVDRHLPAHNHDRCQLGAGHSGDCDYNDTYISRLGQAQRLLQESIDDLSSENDPDTTASTLKLVADELSMIAYNEKYDQGYKAGILYAEGLIRERLSRL